MSDGSGQPGSRKSRTRFVAAGHAVLTLRYTMEHGVLSGYIDDLFVKPQFRRQRIARALLSELFDECRRRTCKSIYVEVGIETFQPSSSTVTSASGRFTTGECYSMAPFQ
jgi:GNAT superfamily N-acetyltransferase